MEGSALTLKNREGTRRCMKGGIRRQEERGHSSWPKIPSGRCWRPSSESVEPTSMREEPVRQGQAGLRRFEQSGRRCRADCLRKQEKAEPRNCLLSAHAPALASHRASGAWQYPAGVPVGAPAGKKLKRAEIGETSYVARRTILPQIRARRD